MNTPENPPSTVPTPAAFAAAEEILATLQAGEPYGESLANHPVREIAAIIDRAASAGWQPIETAPKDGTWILLLHENHSTPTVGRWIDTPTVGRWIDGGWFSDDGLKWPSTHWMPLPPPPSAPSPAKV